jgi:CheY-like chemotaxis protein
MSVRTGSKKGLILIVDDSRLIRTMVRKILKETGYAVEEAVSGSEGLAKVDAEKPDCIILDILMPGMSGYDVLSELKSKSLGVPIIILTADIQDTSRKKCMDLGAVDFINKPPKDDDLINAIDRALAAQRG